MGFHSKVQFRFRGGGAIETLIKPVKYLHFWVFPGWNLVEEVGGGPLGGQRGDPLPPGLYIYVIGWKVRRLVG